MTVLYQKNEEYIEYMKYMYFYIHRNYNILKYCRCEISAYEMYLCIPEQVAREVNQVNSVNFSLLTQLEI